jgi:hypothetical protein
MSSTILIHKLPFASVYAFLPTRILDPMCWSSAPVCLTVGSGTVNINEVTTYIYILDLNCNTINISKRISIDDDP